MAMFMDRKMPSRSGGMLTVPSPAALVATAGMGKEAASAATASPGTLRRFVRGMPSGQADDMDFLETPDRTSAAFARPLAASAVPNNASSSTP